jgi:hypothetical protein
LFCAIFSENPVPPFRDHALAEQACRRDDDPDDERSHAGQQQDFMENSAQLLELCAKVGDGMKG